MRGYGRGSVAKTVGAQPRVVRARPGALRAWPIPGSVWRGQDCGAQQGAVGARLWLWERSEDHGVRPRVVEVRAGAVGVWQDRGGAAKSRGWHDQGHRVTDNGRGGLAMTVRARREGVANALRVQAEAVVARAGRGGPAKSRGGVAQNVRALPGAVGARPRP